MGRLHEIRLKSNAFVANMNVHIAESIKLVETDLVNMNKKQMLDSKTANNEPLINVLTGSPLLSPAYARRTGKSKPNLFLKGAFQDEIFLEANENNNTWFIDSMNFKAKYLVENYGNIFGIFDKKKAKELTGKGFKRLYERLVLGK